MNIKKIFLLNITFLLSFLKVINAQFIDLREAKQYFKDKNYAEALQVYKRLLLREPKNFEYNLNAGICILNIRDSKKEAIKYLQIAATLPDANPDAIFYLARAYHLNLMLDKALENYELYKKNGKGTKIEEIDYYIQTCKNAQNLISSPLDVTFENLGDNINTKYPDYLPFVPKDESFLIFTSRRKQNMGAVKEIDGFYPSDIWISITKEGEFSPAERLGPTVNTIYDDEVTGMSPDGSMIFIYLDNIKEYGDIYYSIKKEKDDEIKFTRKKKLSTEVNSDKFESAATISMDKNTLFFASDRPGTIGGKDIYMTRKLPNGNWALAQNIGEPVNSKYDEDFPYLSFDGKTLYFASKGHNTMGGYDIFKTTWDPENNTFSMPENIGYPINTPDDNFTFIPSENQKYGYTFTWREDSKGDWDIYRVIFNQKDDRLTIIQSVIYSKDSSKTIIDAFISVVDKSTGEEIGTYIPNARNGKFVMTLAPGIYEISIDATGYQFYTEDLKILGKSDYVPMMKKVFYVKK